MKRPGLLTLPAVAGALAVLVSACATMTVETLRGADVPIADQPPATKEYVGARPGSQKPITRTFAQQPPLIPHALPNFDEITLESNDCLTCHGADTYEKKKAPKMGDSHFKDREGRVLDKMAMSRYQCSQCHVPQVDAPPLVESTFVGTPLPAKP